MISITCTSHSFPLLALAGVMIAASAASAGRRTRAARRRGASDILIRGAKVYTVSARGTLDNADVLVRGGKIVAVTQGGAGGPQVPAGAKVVEAKGRALTPGLFAGLTHIGLEEISAESSTVDATLDFKAPTWEQKWRPEFDVVLAYNPRSTVVPVTRIEGLTWTVLAPGAGDSIIAGQGGAVAFDGTIEQGSRAMIDGSRSLFVELGSVAEKFSGGSRAAYMLLDQAISERVRKVRSGQTRFCTPPGAVRSCAISPVDASFSRSSVRRTFSKCSHSPSVITSKR